MKKTSRKIHDNIHHFKTVQHTDMMYNKCGQHTLKTGFLNKLYKVRISIKKIIIKVYESLSQINKRVKEIFKSK